MVIKGCLYKTAVMKATQLTTQYVLYTAYIYIIYAIPDVFCHYNAVSHRPIALYGNAFRLVQYFFKGRTSVEFVCRVDLSVAIQERENLIYN